MFRRLFRILLVVLIVVGLFLAYALLAPGGPTSEKYVLLRPGLSTRGIAVQLEREGIIHNRYGFLLLHAFRMRSLKAGEYRFAHPASAIDVYDRLARGDIYKHTIVIPEGQNSFDIAAAIEAAGLGTRDDFLKVVREHTDLIRDLDPRAASLEGYLFPDTYEFTRTQTLPEIAGVMVRRFKQEAKQLGLEGDLHRVVTLASIVEKETAAAAERPIVASVYNNRLGRGMGLQADPSVVYAALMAGQYSGAIHVSDLERDSPYNTYRNAGLPPGPVANPGRASLEAALHPAQTSYLYFVADNRGGHKFASTLDEHNRNVAAYRRGQQ